MTTPKVAALLKKLSPRNRRNEFISSLSHNLEWTEALIQDRETKGASKTKGASNNSMNDWLRDAGDVCEEARDLLDEFACRSDTSSSFIDRLVIDVVFSRRSQVVNGKLKQIHKNVPEFDSNALSVPSIDDAHGRGRTTTTSFPGREVYGRDKEIADLENMLLHQNNVNHYVISVVGMGGVGKTYLAQKIFNDHKISDHFEAKGWVCVSQNCSSTEAVKRIIISLTGKDTKVDDGLDTLLLRLRNVVEGKRVLLVLDDVWTVDPWWEQIQSCFASASKGSRILITTRDEKVARRTGTTEMYRLKGLSTEACWQLFSDRAFHESSAEESKSFEEIGRKIVAKCDGLPLAVKVVGNMLRGTRTLQEWDSVLQNEKFVAEDSIFPVLQLSYDHLNTTLKQCLAYCRIFPKDRDIEIDTLIKLWMAQGHHGLKYMESTGYRVLEELRASSFFQDPDHGINNKSCKIHGTVHDFLHSLWKKECVISKVDRVTGSNCKYSDPEKVRHSTLVVEAQSSLPVSDCPLENLRTLLILSNYAFVTTGWLLQLFEHSRLLRALHFSCCSIEKIPSQLGKLNRLRYLNLSYNRNLKELPEAVCDLYLLQTLNLNGCDHLEKLPEGIVKLINLRHLEILWTLSLSFLPKGIEKLSSLRNLNRFVVSPSSGNKACKLGELEKLNKLQDYLYIDGLADLASADEARKANLHSKEGLRGLDLWFSGVGTDKDNMQNVVEALQPPPELKYLGIHYYGGTVLPTWMASLKWLRKLILFYCTNCESFLCVATLPYLQSLEIRDMPNVKELSFDAEVLGKTPFPMLNRLCIYNMKQLNDWKVTVRGAVDSTCPSLRQLSIGNCPELHALPHYLQGAKLEELGVSECPKLNEWLKTPNNRNKLSHIPNIKIDDPDVQIYVQENGSSESASCSRTFTRVGSPSCGF